MWIPFDNWQASSSFQQAVTPPTVEPNATPLVCVSFNQSWLPYIIASLMQLTQPAAWDAAPAAVLTVLDQATALIEQFITGVGCVSALEFRVTDTCILQYSTDGGVTWIDVTGWTDFAATCFTGPAGPPGSTGPAGPSPTFRLSGCVLQYSLDGGSTWTNVSGWSTSALQACLSGTPGNPQGVSTAQQACNIASWLAIQILQGALSSAAASLTAAAALLDAVTNIIALALGFVPVLDIALTAGAAFMAAATAIGASALSAAGSDAILRQNLVCAIYEAILPDGHVTATNITTILTNINAISYATPGIVGLLHDFVSNLGFTGINAIQAEGSLATGDCSACGTWCFEWDLRTAFAPWTYVYSPGADGTWTSGVGVVGSNDTGKWEADIKYPFGGSHTLTDIEMDVLSPGANAGTPSFIDAQTTTNHYTNFTQGASGSIQTLHASVTANPVTQVNIRLASSLSAAACVIQKVRFRGTGTNPFGTTNCV